MKMRALAASAILLLLPGSGLVFAQFIQQGSKLVGTDVVGAAYQGGSVAISADGNTAIVGGGDDNSHVGASWLYTRSGGMWAQQGAKLVGTGAAGLAHQGSSVAISGDGNTAIVAGGRDNSNAGAVWVFTRTGEVWTQQGAKLVGTGAVGPANQGFLSVAISADGDTAIVGGYNDNSSAGAAWVFARSGEVWSQQGSKLVGTGAVGPANQGASVAISADGNTAVVGGGADNSFAGAAWVFTRSAGLWTQQGAKLVGAGAVGPARQSRSVAIAPHGNTAIVGGYGDNSNAGAAWVFTRSGGVWTQQGPKLVGAGAVGAAYQGGSVAISGNTAIVAGGRDNSDAGAAWVFTRSAGVWSQLGNKLVGAGATGFAQQGSSVAISADGNTAIVGGGGDNSLSGAAWVFKRGLCASSATSLCLDSGRFEVSVDWINQHASPATPGVGTAVPDTDQSGFFWFFGPDNVELVVKVLDGEGVNGYFWVFYGALSDVEYTVTVTDKQTGAVKTYHNDPGNICGQADTAAFPSP